MTFDMRSPHRLEGDWYADSPANPPRVVCEVCEEVLPYDSYGNPPVTQHLLLACLGKLRDRIKTLERLANGQS